MSADNWAICPKCKAKAEAAKAGLQMEADAAYGKLSVEEFDVLRTKAAAPIDEDALSTFREDYEFYGAEDGEFHAEYSGGCDVCGLSFKFSHVEVFYPERED